MADWVVRTYFKKSIEEHEHFTKDGQEIVRKTGWRSGSWTVVTSDENPPEFEFDFVPGGDGRKDSIDMNNCFGNNIEEVEMIETWDGCWEDIDWPEDMDEEEQEALLERIEEDGFYDVIEDQEGWMQSDTEMWIWGPIAIEDSEGNIARIIEAAEDGSVVYKSEKDYE